MVEKRKIVFAGCGGITKAWMGALQSAEDAEVVGICDLDAARMDAFEEQWKLNVRSKHTELARVIRESGADTVFDCTIPAAHPTVTKTALLAGCDVLGEKPMAETMEDAISMVETARKAGKTYAVIQNRRYLPGIRRFRKALEAARIGELTTLDVDFYIGAHFGGFRAEMDHVLLVDMAIHTFDQARFISGKDAVEVFAVDWNPAGSWYRHGANAVAMFEMTGGLRFTYRGSWCAEGMNTSWEGRWRAVCETGTLAWDGGSEIKGEHEAGGETLIHSFAPIEIAPEEPLAYTGHAGVIRDFLDSLREGRKPMTVCTDNIRSIAMVLAAVESAESGKKAKVWRGAV